MSNLKTRITAIEKAKGERIEVVWIGDDGVERNSQGQPVEPSRNKHEKVITIVRSYGMKSNVLASN